MVSAIRRSSIPRNVVPFRAAMPAHSWISATPPRRCRHRRVGRCCQSVESTMAFRGSSRTKWTQWVAFVSMVPSDHKQDRACRQMVPIRFDLMAAMELSARDCIMATAKFFVTNLGDFSFLLALKRFRTFRAQACWAFATSATPRRLAVRPTAARSARLIKSALVALTDSCWRRLQARVSPSRRRNCHYAVGVSEASPSMSPQVVFANR